MLQMMKFQNFMLFLLKHRNSICCETNEKIFLFLWGWQLINDSSWKNSSPFTDPSSSRDERRLQKEPLKHISSAWRSEENNQNACGSVCVCVFSCQNPNSDGWFSNLICGEDRTENNLFVSRHFSSDGAICLFLNPLAPGEKEDPQANKEKLENPRQQVIRQSLATAGSCSYVGSTPHPGFQWQMKVFRLGFPILEI